MKRRIAFFSVIAMPLLGCVTSPAQKTEVSEDIQGYLQPEHLGKVLNGEPVKIELSKGYNANLLAAVLQNKAYLSAVALEREAFSQIGVAESFRRPQADTGARIGAVREFGGDQEASSGIAGGLSVSQLIYDGGASASAVNRATALAFAARADRLARANETALAAARAWIEFWQYSERLHLVELRTSEISLLVDQIERMADNGLLDRASLDGARRQIVEIELEKARLRNGQAEAAVSFQHFFGGKPTELPQPKELISAAQARAIAREWHSAPALQRIAAEVYAAKVAITEAEAAFRPSANLNAGTRTPTGSAKSTDLSFGVSLNYTWGDGGRRRAQLESAQLRYDAVVAQLTDAQKSMQSELEGMVMRLSTIESSAPLLQEKLRLSRSEAETSRSQQMTGQSNLRQLVEAEMEIYRAQDEEISLNAEKQILLMSIAARTGALSELIGLYE